MTHYWFLVRIRLGRPLEVYGAEGQRVEEKHTHYRQYFGITADSSQQALERLKELLSARGDVFESFEETRENVDIGLLDEHVQKKCRDFEASGIWYQSGRLPVGPV